jgi:hypothetical protein
LGPLISFTGPVKQEPLLGKTYTRATVKELGVLCGPRRDVISREVYNSETGFPCGGGFEYLHRESYEATERKHSAGGLTGPPGSWGI